jgi:antitoxin component YwqK of YwqJK toxin-antitoxin module
MPVKLALESLYKWLLLTKRPFAGLQILRSRVLSRMKNIRKNKVYMKFALAISGLLLFIGCKNQSNSDSPDNFKLEYYNDGNIKTIIHYTNGKKNGPAIYFWSDGKLSHVQNYSVDSISGEKLSFQKNGGLAWKYNFRGKDANGFGYDFYPSGALKSFRQYRNNIPYKFGFDYYDSTMVIKMILYFNDKGEFYDRIIYDRNSRRIPKDSINFYLHE